MEKLSKLLLLQSLLAGGAEGMAPPGRRPWEFGRFLSTAAAFNSPSDLLSRLFGGSGAPSIRRAPGELLWSPQAPNGLEFAVLDDGLRARLPRPPLTPAAHTPLNPAPPPQLPTHAPIDPQW